MLDNEMNEIDNTVAKALFGMSIDDAKEQGVCLQCKKKVTLDNMQDILDYDKYTLCKVCYADMRQVEAVVPIEEQERVVYKTVEKLALRMALDSFVDGIAKAMFDMSLSEAQEKGVCLECKREITGPDAQSELFKLSSICPECGRKSGIE